MNLRQILTIDDYHSHLTDWAIAFYNKNTREDMLEPYSSDLLKRYLFQAFYNELYQEGFIRSWRGEIISAEDLKPLLDKFDQWILTEGDEDTFTGQIYNEIKQLAVAAKSKYLPEVSPLTYEVVLFADIDSLFTASNEVNIKQSDEYLYIDSLIDEEREDALTELLRNRLITKHPQKRHAFRLAVDVKEKLSYLSDDPRIKIIIVSDLDPVFIKSLIAIEDFPPDVVEKIDIRSKTYGTETIPVDTYFTRHKPSENIFILSTHPTTLFVMYQQACKFTDNVFKIKNLQSAIQSIDHCLNKRNFVMRVGQYFQSLYGRLIGIPVYKDKDSAKAKLFKAKMEIPLKDRFTFLFAKTYLPRDVYNPNEGIYGRFKGEDVDYLSKDGQRHAAFSTASLAKGFFGIPFLPEGERGIAKKIWGGIRIGVKSLLSVAKLFTEYSTGSFVILTDFALDRVKQKVIASVNPGRRLGWTALLIGLKVLSLPFQLLHYAGKAATSPLKNARDSWNYFADLRESEYLFDRILGYMFGSFGFTFSMLMTTLIYTLAAPYIAAGLSFLGAGIAALAVKAGLGGVVTAVSSWAGTVTAFVGPYVIPHLTTIGNALSTGLSFVANFAATYGFTATASVIASVAAKTTSLAALILVPLLPSLGNAFRALWAYKDTDFRPKIRPVIFLNDLDNDEPPQFLGTRAQLAPTLGLRPSDGKAEAEAVISLTQNSDLPHQNVDEIPAFNPAPLQGALSIGKRHKNCS